MKELLIYLIKNRDKDGFMDFMRGFEPLDLDPAMIRDYLDNIIGGTVPQDLMDAVETLYEDIEDKEKLKERLKALEDVGVSGIIFNGESDEEDTDDFADLDEEG